MKKTVLALVLVTFGGVNVSQAASSCGDMLMPAAQLKQVARGLSRTHSGLDLLAPYGSTVRAALGGTVVFAGHYYAYGNIIDIRHPEGMVTRYAHLSIFANGIHPGALVRTGEPIGAVGTTGNAHGSHLHFEVRVGNQAVDPKPFLALASCTIGAPREAIEEAHAPDIHRPSRRK